MLRRRKNKGKHRGSKLIDRDRVKQGLKLSRAFLVYVSQPEKIKFVAMADVSRMPVLRVPRYIAVGRFCFRRGGYATTGESSPRLLSAILRLCNPVSFGRDPATSANQWKLKQQPMNYALSTQPAKFPFSWIYDSFSIIAKRALSTTKRSAQGFETLFLFHEGT